jgi:hypothetical protein
MAQTIKPNGEAGAAAGDTETERAEPQPSHYRHDKHTDARGRDVDAVRPEGDGADATGRGGRRRGNSVPRAARACERSRRKSSRT